MRKSRKILAVLLALAVLGCICTAAADENWVKVSNYKELLKAVNEKGATRILISSRYRHGTADIENIYPRGKELVIAAEEGQSAVINGRVDIYGPGKVTFENISIEAPQETVALWVGGEAEVAVDSVRGGDGKSNNPGGHGAIVTHGTLTVGTAVGGNSVGNMGGDGIAAADRAVVTVGEAVGGSARDGIGGAGVSAMSGTKVTVTGKATGGDGAVAPGQAVLAGTGSSAEVAGETKDGEKLESKKAADPEKISNYAMLCLAVRSGKTEIQLDPSYRAGIKKMEEVPLFAFNDEPVTIRGSAKNGKPQRIDFGFCISGGNWEFSDLEISTKDSIVLMITGNCSVRFDGNVSTTARDATAVYLADTARLNMTGDITVTGGESVGLYMTGSPEAEVKGNLTAKGTNSNIIGLKGGRARITGDLSMTTIKYPAVYATTGELILEGNINSQVYCISTEGDPSIQVKGNLTTRNNKYHCIYLEGGSVEIEGDVSAKLPWKIKSGELTVNGEKKH